jgi:hypothetical protein
VDEEFVTRPLYGGARGRRNGDSAASGWQKESIAQQQRKRWLSQPAAVRPVMDAELWSVIAVDFYQSPALAGPA